jgi:hypothetical protein
MYIYIVKILGIFFVENFNISLKDIKINILTNFEFSSFKFLILIKSDSLLYSKFSIKFS